MTKAAFARLEETTKRSLRASIYFSVLMAGTITWPSRKTIFSTEANSGSARRASATLNEGSGFHVAPPLTSDSAASVIA